MKGALKKVSTGGRKRKEGGRVMTERMGFLKDQVITWGQKYK